MSYCLAVDISRQAYRGTESPLRVGFKREWLRLQTTTKAPSCR